MWIAVLCTTPVGLQAAEEWIKLKAAMHIHSTFSTGDENIEDIASLALEHGVDVLVITDDDILDITYGLPFLRRLTSYTRTKPALFSSRAMETYLDEIKQVDERHPELILIEGVESAPFYYWGIDILAGEWFFHNWNKHLICIGLDEEDYLNLPILGGEGIRMWHWSSLLLLWPLAGLVYVVVAAGRHPAFLRWTVLAISLVALAENIPFTVPLMDQYNGDLGAAPYQYYIDYVNDRGGMVFWPHAEARSTIPPESLLGGRLQVGSKTPAHAEDLVLTRRYTGFAALYGDNITATEPGREWDQVLNEYLVGVRDRPSWGTGEIDYHGDVPGNQIHDILTVLYVRERSRLGVMEALRQGRIYAVRGGDQQLELNRFEVKTDIGQGIVGEHVKTMGKAEVHIELAKMNGLEEEVQIRLVRSGVVVADFWGTTPLEFTHIESAIKPEEKLYYRLLANSRTAKLTANPIFVSGTKVLK
jgi:hypothetical protein